MIENLSEIVKAQHIIQHKHFDLEIDRIIQFLDNNDHVSRKEIKEIFGEVKQLMHSLQDIKITNQYTRLYNDIYDTIYLYEKDFLIKRRSVKTLLRQLDIIQQNYQKDLSNAKQVFSKTLNVKLDEYFNLFELNLDLLNQNYTRNFIDKIDIFDNRINGNLSKKIYKNHQTAKHKLHADLLEMKSFFNLLDKSLEIAKNRATQKLVKERSQLTLNLFNWDNDSQYMEYMSYWKNEFIIDKFLGIVGQYLDWKYPVAYIDPNIGELTRHMLSGDPFYVIDDRTMPYDNLLQFLPPESQRKIHHYNKKISDSSLEDSSVQVCISWNNFSFMTQGNINKDLILMSKILKPGGYTIFNYADAHSAEGTKFCNDNIVPVCWKQKIDQFARENQLTEKVTYNFKDYPFSVAVYQKEGYTDDINIVNKLGLVLPNPDYLQQLKEDKETEEEIKQRIQKNKQEEDLKRLHERDKLSRDIDIQRKLGNDSILKAKLQSSINHLNSLLAQSNNDYTQPIALEAVLHISKLTYHLGRIKDSKNILKRVSRDIKNMNKKDLTVRKFLEWENFLNNIDT